MTGGRDTGLGAVRVIDPSLFTAPYDEALVAALGRAGADAQLVTRPARAGEAELAAQVPVRRKWYRWCDAAPRKLGALGAALKAGEHVVSSLVHLVALRKSGAAHFQWLPFPLADRFLLALWRRMMPVVVTVHDTEPFNNTPTSPVQRWGFAKALRQAHQLIVHTEQGRARLVALGLDEARISVIPHGVGDAPQGVGPAPGGARWCLVLFGKIRPYKGVDLLVEAAARLPEAVRAGLRIVIAGEPMMDLAPLEARIAEAGLADCVELRPGYLDEAGMAALFGEADGFVFPYREIEASGVLYQVAGLHRWLIASDIGAFKEAMTGSGAGALVAAEDVAALAAAIAHGATERPQPQGRIAAMAWDDVAARTVDVYEAAARDFAARLDQKGRRAERVGS